MSRKSGYRFSDEDMRQRKKRMSRKSGYRFSDEDMRQRKKWERIPVRLNRDAIQG